MNLSSKGKEEKVGCFWNHWSAEPKLMIYNYGYMHVYGGNLNISQDKQLYFVTMYNHLCILV